MKKGCHGVIAKRVSANLPVQRIWACVYSGTFVDQQDDDAAEEAKYPLGAWEYHSSMKLIETSEKKPLRIFTHVSENDNRAKDPEEGNSARSASTGATIS